MGVRCEVSHCPTLTRILWISFLEPYYSGGSAKGGSYQLSSGDSLPPVSLGFEGR